MNRAVQVDFLMSGLIDSSGNPLSGGKVWSYEAGTNTLKALYTDQAKTTEAANPVILGVKGQSLVYGDGGYKLVIQNSAGVLQDTLDNLIFVYPDNDIIYAGTSTGSSNAYVVTPSPALTALTDGLTISFVANHATSGAATLNPSGLGAYSFVANDGTTALTTGDILSGQIVDARFITSSNHFRLVSQAGVQPVSGGGTGASTAAGARTNLGLGTIATQNASSVTVTALTATTSTITTLTAGTVVGDSAAPLILKSRTGRSIDIYEEGTNKASIPSGTTSGSCIFSVGTNNNYILGQSSYAFKNIYTYAVTYKNGYAFNNGGDTYTTRIRLNPATATAAQVADYVLTLTAALSAGAGVSFTP
jgi:hypothetical protein